MDRNYEMEILGLCALGTVIKACNELSTIKDEAVGYMSELISLAVCKMYTGNFGTEKEMYEKMIVDDEIHLETKEAIERFCIAPQSNEETMDRLTVALEMVGKISEENLYLLSLFYFVTELIPELKIATQHEKEV